MSIAVKVAPVSDRRRAGRRLALLFALGFAGALRAADTLAVAQNLAPADLQFFENKIRPLFADKCYKCHSRDADKVKGGLMLDTREAWLHGGNTGPALVPGKPDDSLLIQAIRYADEDLQMPPEKDGGKLSDAQIADLTEWVRRGAPDPRTLVSKGSSSAYGGVGKAHWAFQPVKKPEPPAVSNPAWVRTPVDAFVLAKLDANGMAPNSPADKSTLIRRVTFDLIGLPPTEQEIEDFLTDTRPGAYARVVDRLLASPRYGERWARYWLDVARYSDTKGEPPKQKNTDPRFPFAWTYRDYVIDAFNKDKPYNQFIIEQLAADRQVIAEVNDAKKKKLEPPTDQSALAALGFLTLGPQFEGRMDDIVGDRIDVTTKAFLGLTVACARCHDHKFDPIPTKDYYSLYGVFANTVVPDELPSLHTKIPKTAELLDYIAQSDELKKKAAKVQLDFQEFRQERVRTRTPAPEQRKELVRREREVAREVADLDSTHAGAFPRANALFDVPNPQVHDYPVLLRGETQNKGPVVPRQFLEILSPDPKHRPEWHDGSGRLQLAQAIADPKNPMTARVLVNRIWQQHFGAGIVLTPDDLGNQSAPPSHPELLDYLAARFMADGWSIKNLHRLIVLSAAYQQSATNNPKYAELDPDNRLLWRSNLRRLDFEEMHDALLTITGELDSTMGGRPVFITSEGFASRRAIYTAIDRRAPPELLTQFDFPSPDVESGRRYTTIVPQQALFLMNSPMVIEAARKLVDRPAFAALQTDEERVASLYLAVYQRPPSKQEIALALRFVKQNPAGTAVDLPAPVASDPPPTAKDVRKDARQANNPKRPAAPGRFAVQVGGTFNNRKPPDAWTKLAHALFQSNEAMFYE
jgi:mono/diheme cytochrome c family protein